MRLVGYILKKEVRVNLKWLKDQNVGENTWSIIHSEAILAQSNGLFKKKVQIYNFFNKVEKKG